MLSKNDLIQRCTVDGVTDWKEYRSDIEARRNHVEVLERIQGEHYATRKTPADTVAEFVDSVGYDAAVATIATLVNRSAWDGRISQKNAEWAMTVSNALDRQTAVDCYIHAKNIHMAHLDQIADDMRKFTPAMEIAAKNNEPQKQTKEGKASGEQQRKRTTNLAR